MALEINVPQFPESVEDGTLVTWYKAEGDSVQTDEKLADIETDKVVLEVASPTNGVLSSVLKQEGDTVRSGEVLGTVEEGTAPPGEAKETKEVLAPVAESTQPVGELLAGPAARKMMTEHGVDPARVSATDPGGKINTEDVKKHLTRQATASKPSGPSSAPLPGERPEERVAMTRIRARIAERLISAQQTAAILSTFNEVNMKPIMDLRTRYKEKFEKEHGVKLGFMSFFVKAVVAALREYPIINASVDGTDIIYHGYYDIGIAVSVSRGLVVPVLRNADQLSFAEIEASIQDFAKRAQEGQLTMNELTGGTFTITNGGVFGSMLSTPIINPPQSAILGMHSIEQRPMAADGQVVILPIMYLALSYDHRVIDGKDAVLSLVTMKQVLEDPARLLLGL